MVVFGCPSGTATVSERAASPGPRASPRSARARQPQSRATGSIETHRYYTAVNEFVQPLANRQAEILALTRELASIESPSGDPAALERCAARLVAAIENAGGAVTRPRPEAAVAAHVVGTWAGRGPRVLLLGHFDTVYPLGHLARQPVEIRDGRLYG